jgi:hypothetical protein
MSLGWRASKQVVEQHLVAGLIIFFGRIIPRRQRVGDPFVAVNAGRLRCLAIHCIPVVGNVLIRAARGLLVEVHGDKLVAVMALPRIGKQCFTRGVRWL